MLIAQITDLHIGPGKVSELNQGRLEAVVSELQRMRPDVVLATGDLTDSGSAESYAQVKTLLAPLKAPVLPAIGNHDQREAFVAEFGDAFTNDGFVQYAVERDGLRIIVLDTVETGRHGGAFCERRAAWLTARLNEQPDTPTLIAMHHPPLRSGIAWMDHGSEGDWSRRLHDVLLDRPQVVGLVAGHLHRTMVAGFAGTPLVVAPPSSPWVALDLGPEMGGGADLVPRIIEEEPGFALHVWENRGLVSHFGSAANYRILASLDVAADRIVADRIVSKRV